MDNFVRYRSHADAASIGGGTRQPPRRRTRNSMENNLEAVFATTAANGSDLASWALRLRIDAYTVEVVKALRDAGIRSVLLKGPVIVTWLYRHDPGARRYCDADILVSPADLPAARNVLEQLGFRARGHEPIEADEHHAREYLRVADWANVDLHRTLHGMEAVPYAEVWETVVRHLTTLEILGAEVEVPDAVLRTLNVALHLDPLDEASSQSWRDLERAIAEEDTELWWQAVALARELGIEDEVAVRLRRVPAGARLADALGVKVGTSAYYHLVGAVTRGDVPPWAYAISRVGMQHGARAKAAYVLSKLVPPEEQLRQQSQLARRGRRGYAAARGVRVLICVWRFPQALVIYDRARRS